MGAGLLKLSISNRVNFVKLYFQNRLISSFFKRLLSCSVGKKSLTSIFKKIYSIFSSYMFMISMLRPLINQVFILEYDVTKGSIFSLWQNGQSLSQ